MLVDDGAALSLTPRRPNVSANLFHARKIQILEEPRPVPLTRASFNPCERKIPRNLYLLERTSTDATELSKAHRTAPQGRTQLQLDPLTHARRCTHGEWEYKNLRCRQGPFDLRPHLPQTRQGASVVLTRTSFYFAAHGNRCKPPSCNHANMPRDEGVPGVRRNTPTKNSLQRGRGEPDSPP